MLTMFTNHLLAGMLDMDQQLQLIRMREVTASSENQKINQMEVVSVIQGKEDVSVDMEKEGNIVAKLYFCLICF